MELNIYTYIIPYIYIYIVLGKNLCFRGSFGTIGNFEVVLEYWCRALGHDIGLLCSTMSFQGYDTLPIGTSGQPVRNKVYTRTSLAERTLRAWLSVPRKAFISAWVATGYFQSERFPEEQLTPAQAREALDPTGMLLSLGIKNDVIAFGSSQPERQD